MPKVAVVTDSNSGITQAMAKDMGIRVLPMPFTVEDEAEKTYYEDINLTREEFFQMQEDGKKIVTSQPTPGNIMKTWDEVLEKYDELVYIPMSSGLSGSCQSAKLLAEDYDGRVQVVNNQRISVTQKRSVQDAMALAGKGKSADEIRQILEKVKFDSSIYIMLDTLKYLRQGGRITPAAAAIGTLLRIKPVLQIKGERLDAFAKARTSTQGRATMIRAMKHDVDELFGGQDNVHLYAVHSQGPDDLDGFRDEIEKAFPGVPVEEDKLSLSVCCHIGRGSLAIACSKKLDI